jgi:inorganic triphosphatase YgiF
MLNERVGRAPAEGAIGGAANGPGRSEAKDEVELKLLVPAGALDQLRAAPVIVRHARNAGVARRLEAVYYDTPDHALLSHGLSLRVRRSGNRHVQTLKRESVLGRPFVRGEWETTVDGTTPDLASLPVSEIGAPLDRLAPSALDPIFVTKVRRRTQRLDVRGTIFEIAFDEGSIEAGERWEPLTEIELELKTGDPRTLYEVGIELLAIAPLRIGIRSKPDRGYDLAFDLAPKATRATAPSITAAHTLDDVVGVLLATCQHQVLVNQAVAEAGRDPEGVHQMRVALRRFRTACALLRRELGSPQLQAFNTEGKWFATLLGAARDWDVFVTETLSAPSAALASDTVDFDGLRQAAEPHRRIAYAALREALASERYNRFQLSLRHWIESRGWRNELEGRSLGVLLDPAPAFAGRALTWLHGKALNRGAHFRHLGPEARHRLRIALKKLRYTTEFFRGLYGERETRNYIGWLARLQDALGHDNDALMTWPFLCTLLQDPVTPEVQRTIGAVMGWQVRDRIDTPTVLRNQWRRFKATPTFWSG